MKLKYMIEYAMRESNTNPHYESIAVWVQGPGPGLDIEMAYLPGNEQYQEAADWIINRLVENDIKSLQEDFLEYHQATMSPYWGMRDHIIETEEYASMDECMKAVITILQQKR